MSTFFQNLSPLLQKYLIVTGVFCATAGIVFLTGSVSSSQTVLKSTPYYTMDTATETAIKGLDASIETRLNAILNKVQRSADTKSQDERNTYLTAYMNKMSAYEDTIKSDRYYNTAWVYIFKYIQPRVFNMITPVIVGNPSFTPATIASTGSTRVSFSYTNARSCAVKFPDGTSERVDGLVSPGSGSRSMDFAGTNPRLVSGTYEVTCYNGTGATGTPSTKKTMTLSVTAPTSTAANNDCVFNNIGGLYIGANKTCSDTGSTVNVYGTNSSSTLTVNNSSSLTIDQNVQTINFPFAKSQYQAVQQGNTIKLVAGNRAMNITISPSGTRLNFTDGQFTATNNRAILSIGSQVINANPAIVTGVAGAAVNNDCVFDNIGGLFIGANKTCSDTGSTVNVYGTNNSSTLTVNNSSSLTIDQNVQTINFPFAKSQYQAVQQGNTIKLVAGNRAMNITISPSGTRLNFTDGQFTATNNRAILSIGSQVINANPAIVTGVAGAAITPPAVPSGIRGTPTSGQPGNFDITWSTINGADYYVAAPASGVNINTSGITGTKTTSNSYRAIIPGGTTSQTFYVRSCIAGTPATNLNTNTCSAWSSVVIDAAPPTFSVDPFFTPSTIATTESTVLKYTVQNAGKGCNFNTLIGPSTGNMASQYTIQGSSLVFGTHPYDITCYSSNGIPSVTKRATLTVTQCPSNTIWNGSMCKSVLDQIDALAE